MKELPPVDFIRDALDYCDETGVLLWKKRPDYQFKDSSYAARWNATYAGKDAGSIRRGYRVIILQYSWYMGHRLVWALWYGEDPGELHIDHINGNRSDNRISNLRLVTHQQNHRNRGVGRLNNSGVLGVSFSKRTGKYSARIKVDGRSMRLGAFRTLEEAAAARASAEAKYGFSGRRDKSFRG